MKTPEVTTLCRSGEHRWRDPISAGRCCNAWHLEYRAKPGPEDDPLGWVKIDLDDGCYVWVVDPPQEEQLRSGIQPGRIVWP